MPQGVVSVTAWVIGGGGGGGGVGVDDASAAGGGGAGGLVYHTWTGNLGGLKMSYALGAGGVGGDGEFNGSQGGNTAFTLLGKTLKALGGVFNASITAEGGSGEGGTAVVAGGSGAGASGNDGGGAGGAIGGVNGTSITNGGASNGAQSADYEGLQAVVVENSLSWTAGGIYGPDDGLMDDPATNNGGPATGFGCGGASANYNGGDGGDGMYGGGGGGAAGAFAPHKGGSGGSGVVVLQFVHS